MSTGILKTQIGLIRISADENGITAIEFENKISEPADSGEDNMHIAEAKKQLSEYFAGERKAFDLQLSVNGTEFQKKVWRELLNIPYGETRSYSQTAQAIGAPKAARAVGMANNRNPVPIIVPCHRVIGKNGDLTGYAGGSEIKRFLLDLEKKNSN